MDAGALLDGGSMERRVMVDAASTAACLVDAGGAVRRLPLHVRPARSTPVASFQHLRTSRWCLLAGHCTGHRPWGASRHGLTDEVNAWMERRKLDVDVE